MAELTLYTNPMSRGQIARWMVEETGLPYDEVVLDFDGGMKTPEYLDINPMGKVPAIRHGGRVVTEGAAICAYLAEAVPDVGLAPTEAERADYYRWLLFAAGPVEAAVTAHAFGLEAPPERAKSVGYGSYDQVVDVLEHAVSRHPFIAGDRFTAADVYVGSQVLWGTMFKTLPERDAFHAYADRLTARPAYKAAKAKDEALMA